MHENILFRTSIGHQTKIHRPRYMKPQSGWKSSHQMTEYPDVKTLVLQVCGGGVGRACSESERPMSRFAVADQL